MIGMELKIGRGTQEDTEDCCQEGTAKTPRKRNCRRCCIQMTTWFVEHYDLLKDFAMPVAAIFAAVVAAGIAAIFGLVQMRIANSQRDLARDRLKFDLHQKRYEIYDAAKSLLEHTLMVH